MQKNTFTIRFNPVLFICICFLFSCRPAKNENANTEINKSDSLHKVKVDSLVHIIDSIEKPQSDWLFTDLDKEYLQSLMKVDDPAAFLEKDLRKKPEIIPEKGILGGTMYFEEFSLLSKNWAIAGFSDGHIYGKCLLEYKIDNNKTVNWKVIKYAIQ